MAVAQASKTSVKKNSSSSTKKAAAKSAPSHPPYIDMITEALVSLKERTGSSHYAIAKHIEEQQKIKDLPSNFKKLLFNQLKKFVASGKLVMVKKSFKLPPASSKKSTTAPAAEKPKAKAKETTAAAKKTAAKSKTTSAAEKPKAVAKKPKKAATTAKSPAKKVAPAKAKKPKSIKSPVKKVTAVKKTTVMKKTSTKK